MYSFCSFIALINSLHKISISRRKPLYIYIYIYINIYIYIVTVGLGSKPDQKIFGGKTGQTYVRRISLVYYTLLHCERGKIIVTGINFIIVFIARKQAACF